MEKARGEKTKERERKKDREGRERDKIKERERKKDKEGQERVVDAQDKLILV